MGCVVLLKRVTNAFVYAACFSGYRSTCITIAVTLGSVLSQQLCLPVAWQAFETVYTNNPDPRQDNAAFMRWRDMGQQAERFDFMSFQNHGQREAYQILNFATGFSYFVQESQGQPQTCTLSKLTGPMIQECLFANATKRGSGFVGGSFAVDFWHEEGTDFQGAPFFMDATLQSNTASPVPVEVRQVFFQKDPRMPPFFELIQFWNYVPGTVNSTLFQTPSICHALPVQGEFVVGKPFRT